MNPQTALLTHLITLNYTTKKSKKLTLKKLVKLLQKYFLA